jgi:hypothetical protein
VKRKAEHKSSCNIETKKGHHFKLYQTIRANGGWDNWAMKPLEEYSTCESKIQQTIREQYWIEQLKPELNCYKAHREGENEYEKQKFWREENKEVLKEKQKSYYGLNIEVIKEKSKAYYALNTEVIAERRKAYRTANPELIAEQKKAWYEANKKVITERRKAFMEAKKMKKEQETEQ